MRLDHLLSKVYMILVQRKQHEESTLRSIHQDGCWRKKPEGLGQRVTFQIQITLMSMRVQRHCSLFRARLGTTMPCKDGGIAQLGEHLPCTQGVMSSNLIISTSRTLLGETLKKKAKSFHAKAKAKRHCTLKTI